MSPFLSKLLGKQPTTAREKSAALDAAKSVLSERTFSFHLTAEAKANIAEYENRAGLTKAERDEWWKSNHSPAKLAEIQARKGSAKTITHEEIALTQLQIIEGTPTKRKLTADERAFLAANKWDVRKLHERNKKAIAPAPLTKTKHGFLTSKPAAKAAPRVIAPKAITAPASPFADATDRFVIQAATHRSAPESGKAAARAELSARGFTISPDGKAISRSQRGGRACK
jgi:hypothetical protein